MSAFQPRLVLASLSGQADADWARAGADFADTAVLGGIALDSRSRTAARQLVDRGRDEFLPADPLDFLEDQLRALSDAPIQAGFNVRSTTVDPIVDAAHRCREQGGFLELNAHCRQAELCAVGCGETLLADTDRLTQFVGAAADTGVTVGVKVRAEVPAVDLPQTARQLATAGAHYLHVDAMDTESVIADVVAAVDGTACLVIANNGVRDWDTVSEYRQYGADAVSVGRPSDNPVVLERVRRAVDHWDRDQAAPSSQSDETMRGHQG